MCDWLVTVKLMGNLVVNVFCKNKQTENWETQNKTRKIAIQITKTTITIIKKMKTGDTDNRKENAYDLVFVTTLYFPPGLCVCNFYTQQTVTHVNY